MIARKEITTMPLAACCVVIRDGKVLCVSRRDNPSVFGLPGGKLDSSVMEFPEETAQRELREETGITASDMRFILAMRCYGVNGGETYYAYAFLAEVSDDEMSKLTPEQGLSLRWMTPEELQASTCFADYNAEVFEWCRMKGWL